MQKLQQATYIISLFSYTMENVINQKGRRNCSFIQKGNETKLNILCTL